MDLANTLILNVDDNDGARYAKTRMLRAAGFNVIEAANGMDAIRYVKERRPNLVLLDVKLPDMSGIEVCRQIKADPNTTLVLVLQTSAHLTDPVDKIKGLDGGADNYLAAPIDATELIANVNALLRLQHTQSELRNERDKGQYIFDTMTEGFSLLAPDWKVQQMNSEGLRLSERSAAEVIGKIYWEIWPETRGSELEALYRRAMEEKLSGSLEYCHVFSNGHSAWMEVRAYPSFDGGVASFFRDISDRKLAEEKLREADRRKDEFLAMLAHELRNPLAPISAAAELLKLAELPAQHVRNTSDIISRQVEHMTGLINDLLDASRVTTGFVVIAKDEVDISKVVAEAFEQVRPFIETQRHHLTFDLPTQTTYVVGDQKRLVQIVTNLLNNAAKYTPEGGAIHIQLNVDESMVRLSIEDNGIGIPAGLQPRVFDLFTQADRTSDRTQGGLGIGLALVKNLTELHGGKVSCFSEGKGRGSQFTVCLPRHDGTQNAALTTHKNLDETTRTDKPLHILVVDDNADAAEMLALYLGTSGHHVLIEHSSKRALASAKQEKPDVCILDIGLPDMDGNELARRLRMEKETAHVVLIAVTGYSQEQDKLNAVAAGFDHHLVKPVDIGKLVALLNQRTT